MPLPIPGPGRNTKLTPELTTKLCEKLRKALPIEKACDLVGIEEHTYYNWKARGEAGEPDFVAFLQSVRKARAEAQEFWLEVLSNSTVDKSMNPAPAFFVLERSDRKNWGRSEQAEMNVNVVDPKKIAEAIQKAEAEEI